MLLILNWLEFMECVMVIVLMSMIIRVIMVNISMMLCCCCLNGVGVVVFMLVGEVNVVEGYGEFYGVVLLVCVVGGECVGVL